MGMFGYWNKCSRCWEHEDDCTCTTEQKEEYKIESERLRKEAIKHPKVYKIDDGIKEAKVVKYNYKTKKAGIDHNEFYIEFDNLIFNTGDRITYDFRDGFSLLIIATTTKGYTVKLITLDSKSWLPDNYMSPGTIYYKIKANIGEYDSTH